MEELAGREAALWLAAESLTIEHEGELLSRYEVRVGEAGELRSVEREAVRLVPNPPATASLFPLDALGEAGWLKSTRLAGYAPKVPRPPASLQRTLFPYGEAWG